MVAWITHEEAEHLDRQRGIVDAAWRLAWHNYERRLDERGSFARRCHAQSVRSLRTRARTDGLLLRRVGHGLSAFYRADPAAGGDEEETR